MSQLPGLVPHLPFEDYIALSAQGAIGSGGLKRFAVSPLHYWADNLDPDRERKDTKAFKIGRAWHCAVLEPGEFDRRYASNHDAHPLTTRAKLLGEALAVEDPVEWMARVRPVPDDIKHTTKEGKGLYATIEAEGFRPMAASDAMWIADWLPRLQGRTVLPANDIDAVHRMAAFARSLPISRVVFDTFARVGHCETTMLHRDEATGVLLKIRPDYMLEPCDPFPLGLIIDGKSTTDASAEGFARQVWNLDYGLQAALYPRVYQRVMRTRAPPPFLWLAQEKTSPFAARYYAAGADLIEHWNGRIDALLPQVAACMASDTWPGYPETVETLALPAWAANRMAGAGA